MTSVFFAYPEHVAQADSMRRAAKKLSEQDGSICAITWQDLPIEGRFIMKGVLGAIDSADVVVSELTHLNPNVLFETGYAIARAKRVILALDTSTSKHRQSWTDLAILSAIGYTGYRNSDEFVASWLANDPRDAPTPYDVVIEPGFDENSTRTQLLYCKSPQPFETAHALTQVIERKAQTDSITVTVTDPDESNLELLTWYLPRISSASAVVIHFAGADRDRARIFNNRNAFIAGLCYGLEKNLLMIAEPDYAKPFDYQDMLVIAKTADACESSAKSWIKSVVFSNPQWMPQRRRSEQILKKLYFGEHVAENERRTLDGYFVATSAYQQVVASRDAIFIGQRGTGKTANAMQAMKSLQSERGNLAILIKPPGFEFPALTTILCCLPHQHLDYFFDTFWRFVILTEVASEVLRKVDEHPNLPRTESQNRFAKYVDGLPYRVSDSLSERLEKVIQSLANAVGSEALADADRSRINEAFYGGTLPKLRNELGLVLGDVKRVAVFIDNLDKGWERGADFNLLARLILGLMTARGRVTTDFAKSDHWRKPVNVTISVFLRSDIWSYVKREAREPDKLPISEVAWRDPEVLLGVIETRFEVLMSDSNGPAELWARYFSASIGGLSARDYIPKVVLPRPRDAIVFCNEAVSRAVDRGHTAVEEDDLAAATETYSMYAYNALLVENGFTVAQLQDALLGFLGARSVLTYRETVAILQEGGVKNEGVETLVSKLISSYFLGLEVEHDVFVYPDSDAALARALRKAHRLQPDPACQRFQIHTAYRSFLEIADA